MLPRARRDSTEGLAGADPTPTADYVAVICPGLLGPIPALPDPPLQSPALARLLARADRLTAGQSDPLAALLSACGLGAVPGRDCPTGAIGLLGEGQPVDPAAFWMHADPVHLRPDLDRLLVFAGSGIAPDRAEADALLEDFNRHFAEDGLWLIAPEPSRWYLRARRPLDLRTAPLYQVQGGSMAAHLPSGSDAREWMRLLNEAQMLFHANPVNQRRESQGRPRIGGIWTWGLGSLPVVAGQVPDVLVGDHPLMAGLSRWLERPLRPLADWVEGPLDRGGRVVVFWDRHWHALLERDLQDWARAWTDLDAALRCQGRKGQPRAILLDPCQGTGFWFPPRHAGRFWRRGALERFLSVGSAR